MVVEDHESQDPWEAGIASGKVQLLSPYAYFTMGIYLSTIGILGVFGNGLVFFVLVRKKELRWKPHNMLLINMAFSDLFISVFGYPFTTVASFKQKYIFGWFYCTFQGFITSLCAITTLNTLVAVSIFRYVAVCRPELKHHLSTVNTLRILGVVWCAAGFFAVAPLFGWNSYVIEPFGTSCSVDWATDDPYDIMYIYCLILFCYFINVFIMCCCYLNVVKRSKLLKLNPTYALDVDEAKKIRRLKMEAKVTGMCTVIILFYVTVWSPYAFISLASVHVRTIPLWLTAFPTMFAKMASMLNPYIYVATNSNFKDSVTDLFCRGKNKVGPNPRSDKRNKIHLTIDRTKEGIYIGHTEVQVPTDDRTFF